VQHRAVSKFSASLNHLLQQVVFEKLLVHHIISSIVVNMLDFNILIITTRIRQTIYLKKWLRQATDHPLHLYCQLVRL